MNEASNLFFSEWDKDLLRVESENVAASEIETMIMQIDPVTGCTVIGQKDFMLDEAHVAFIIPNDSAPSDLRDQIVSMYAEK